MFQDHGIIIKALSGWKFLSSIVVLGIATWPHVMMQATYHLKDSEGQTPTPTYHQWVVIFITDNCQQPFANCL